MLISTVKNRSRKEQDEITDPVSLVRHEYKYPIPPALLEPIRSFIRPYCEMDPNSDRESDKFYTVRTLYLDTENYKTFWDKQNEISSRFKLRVRTYGRDSTEPIKFEIKRRFNDVFLKTSVTLPGEMWEELLTAPTNGSLLNFPRHERSVLLDFIRLTNTLVAKPKILVWYQRQAFRSRIDRYVRISFDRRIRHQLKNTYSLKGKPGAWFYNDDSVSLGEPGPRVILELKFLNRVPFWLSDMVRRFGLVRGGYSKYCTAVKRALDGQQVIREFALAVPATGLIRSRKLWSNS